MILLVGGRFQGKKKYIKNFFCHEEIFVCKEENYSEFYENYYKYKVIYNVHILIEMCLKNNIPIENVLNQQTLENKVIVGDELGLCIVPAEKSQRQLRDEVGLFYQEVSKKAICIVKMWNGIPILIKGENYFEKICNIV